jgi:DNA-directed RNA polymerase specialized sigma24 family protein
MVTDSTASYVDIFDLNSEITWKNLYLSLGSFARSLVYSFGVPSWKGQEEDIIEDIVQETMRRLLEQSQKAERGEANPIQSLKLMGTVIAQNYCKDLRRRDRRLSRMQPDDYLLNVEVRKGDYMHLFDAICESIDQELLLTQVAHEIAKFPEKQRRALLVDLANRMTFDTQPTSLQKAFLEEGIQLELYQKPLPADPQERSRHVSLLNHAYKRVAHLPYVQKYIAGKLQAAPLHKTQGTAPKNI